MGQSRMQVKDLSPDFGAEVVGLDLREPLSDDERRKLREAFDERGVLVFRGVDIEEAEQNRLTYMLAGRADEADGAFAERAGRKSLVSNREENGIAPYGRLLWHTDSMWSPTPFEAISLWGQSVEQPSVPTTFASGVRAWDTLPDDLRSRVEGLHAVQLSGQVDRGRYAEGEVLEVTRQNDISTITPIAYRHPRTGRTILYVGEQNTLEVLELDAAESEELLLQLFAHIYDPAHTIEHRWQQGDLVIWDNLAVQHGRPDVAVEGPARTLRKTFAPHVVSENPQYGRMG
jgi:alpha-ketoglutarate-dependent taurine dioxygenase